MAGVIPLERLHRFELVLWRSCHAKVFIKYTPIMTPLEDPNTVSIVSCTRLCGDVYTGSYGTEKCFCVVFPRRTA